MTDQQWNTLENTLERVNKTLDAHEERIRALELSKARATGFAAAIGGLFGGGTVAVIMRWLVPLGGA